MQLFFLATVYTWHSRHSSNRLQDVQGKNDGAALCTDGRLIGTTCCNVSCFECKLNRSLISWANRNKWGLILENACICQVVRTKNMSICSCCMLSSTFTAVLYKQSANVCSCKPLHNNASAAVAADMRYTHSAEQSYGHMQLLQASLNMEYKMLGTFWKQLWLCS